MANVVDINVLNCLNLTELTYGRRISVINSSRFCDPQILTTYNRLLGTVEMATSCQDNHGAESQMVKYMYNIIYKILILFINFNSIIKLKFSRQSI